MESYFAWTTDEPGQQPEPPTGRAQGQFPTQADAEAWLATEWEVLAGQGAKAVTLWHGLDVVYGPMSLSPEAGA